jgi:GDP-4-dehydro-6-deoxy-D-mannose reductase
VRVLILGGTGFVGTHLARLCADAGDDVSVASRSAGRPGTSVRLDPRVRRLAADVRDEPSVLAAVAAARPERVFHLAGQASVMSSFGSEAEIIQTNVLGTLHVLRAVREKAPAARVLYVGSAEEYGRADRQPIAEDAPLRPLTPYGVSRAAASLVALRYALAEKIWVARTRSFNHTGPGQPVDYVTPSLAAQLVAARARGETKTVVSTGDLSVRRDFSGVSAVVRAYRALIENGASGEVYNVCSGHAIALVELLARVGKLAGVEPEARPDPARLRPVDVPVLEGDPTKLERTIGFSLAGSLEADLAALVHEVAPR